MMFVMMFVVVEMVEVMVVVVVIGLCHITLLNLESTMTCLAQSFRNYVTFSRLDAAESEEMIVGTRIRSPRRL